MAASSVRVRQYSIPGPGGMRVETGLITFDSDATVEVSTDLTSIVFGKFSGIQDNGVTNNLSIDESAQLVEGVIRVTGNAITIDYTGTSSDQFHYILFGF